MGLIDFLDEAYEGGKLLFALYDHRKRVKLRYKSIKDNSIKRTERKALVNPQSSYSNRGIIEDEIKVSLAQGFKVIVLNDYIEVMCLRTGTSEWASITDYVETSTKLRLINRMKDNLIKLGASLRKPLPNNSIT